jgi:4-carboxymuconolactone decarboxylase
VNERRFGPMPLETMNPDQRRVADAILAGPRKMSTGLRGPFEALLHSPGLAMPAQEVGEHIRFHSSLPTMLNEMAIMLVSRRWTAQFEWHAHRKMAEDAGLDTAIGDAIAVGKRPELDADATAIYEFVEKLLETGNVTDAEWDAVVSRWGKEGAIDLIGLVGFYCMVSFILNVDQYPIPDGLPEPLQALP